MVKKLLFAALSAAVVVSAIRLARAGDLPKTNKYIGVGAAGETKGGCRQCHDSAKKGDPVRIWQGTKHAKAFEALASAEAKKFAKDRGIDDPQTSEKCLKCHQTGYGEKLEFAGTFDPKAGVQCESCHGPGDIHRAVRGADPDDADGKDKIVAAPDAATCKKCHIEESPSYKPFCFKFFEKQIRHLDPRKGRTDDELKAMDCKGECGIDHGK